MKKLTTLLLCLGLMLTYACQDDRYDTDQNRKGGVTAKLNLHTPDYTQVGTRATNESAIMNVTILQFINGTLANKIMIDDKFWGATVETDKLIAMPASTLDPNGALIGTNPNVMVFLANFNGGFDSYLSNLGTSITTYAAFQAATASLDDATANGLAALESVPMTGFYYGGVTEGITNQINVSLTRALAKINFTLNTANFQVDGKHTTVTVKGIELRNVPLTVTLLETDRPSLPSGTQPGSWAGTPKRYPAISSAVGGNGSELSHFDTTDFTILDATHNQSATPLTNFVAYMPENVRGSFTGITTNKDKRPNFINATPDLSKYNVGWTYIYVDLYYSNADGLDGTAQYCIYLGGDAAGDMNILSGVQYNVTTNLYGANDSDTRITVQAGFDPRPALTGNDDVEILGMANSYIINNTNLLNNDGEPLVLPLIQARKGWKEIRDKLNDGTDYVDLFDDMIEDEAWEIVTLWKTENSTANVTGTVSSIEPRSGGNAAKYHAELTLNGGPLVSGNNYVIALRSTVDQTIWWTWHLWVTNYNPDATSPGDINGQVHTYMGQSFWPGGLNYNKVMMDRHLGATGSVTGNAAIIPPTNLEEAEKWYGLMYQWGNKNPFTSNSKGTNTISDATKIYDATGTLIAYSSWDIASLTISNPTNSGDGFPKVSAVGGTNRLIDATRMPYIYFHSGTNNDWTVQDDALWGGIGAKTVFDPCPPGWKLPAVVNDASDKNAWAGFNGRDWTGPLSVKNMANGTDGFTIDMDNPSVFKMYNGSYPVTGSTTTAFTGRYYDDGTTKAWYPASGYRDRGLGAFSNVGANGYSWSASVSGTNGFFLSFYSAGVNPQGSNNRAYGFPVRCLSE